MKAHLKSWHKFYIKWIKSATGTSTSKYVQIQFLKIFLELFIFIISPSTDYSCKIIRANNPTRSRALTHKTFSKCLNNFFYLNLPSPLGLEPHVILQVLFLDADCQFSLKQQPQYSHPLTNPCSFVVLAFQPVDQARKSDML